MPNKYRMMIGKYHPRKGEIVLITTMEKLLPLSHNQEIADELLKSVGLYHIDKYNHIAPNHAVKTPAARKSLIKNAPNPQFMQAMRLLEPILRKHTTD